MSREHLNIRTSTLLQETKDHGTLRPLVNTIFRVGAILLNVTLGENKLMITTVSSDMFFRQYTIVKGLLSE